MYHLHVKRKLRRKVAREPFVYRLDIVDFQYRIKKRPVYFKINVSKLYYLTIKYAQFKRMADRSANKAGTFQSNFLSYLEGRLICMLYRSSLFHDMFSLGAFIKLGVVTINKKYVDQANHLVTMFDLVSFASFIKKKLLLIYLERLNFKRMLFPAPAFMYISYKFLLFFIRRQPVLKDFYYPFKIDLFRMIGFQDEPISKMIKKNRA